MENESAIGKKHYQDFVKRSGENVKLKGPKEKTINGVECVCRELAADALQISVSTLDKIVAKTKSGKASVSIKFIQFTKGSQLWFPKEGLKEFVNELMVSGGSAI